MNFIEPLESRIAPAAVLTYTDLDGDKVTVTSSAGTNAELTSAAHFVADSHGFDLVLLDVSNAAFNGTTITVAVAKAATGDGLAAIGRINAGANDLGTVTIKGDLGVIDAGSGSQTVPAIHALNVQSMGRYGLDSQGGVGDLQSDINGALGALHVSGDVEGVYINVLGGSFATVKSVNIAGSLIGGASLNSGTIQSTGDIGTVKIGHDVQGGTGAVTGQVFTLGALGNVSIGGALIGGSGVDSGVLSSNGNMGVVKIGHDLFGGSGNSSGAISADTGTMAGINIGGSMIGSTGLGSARIFTGADMGAIKIGHDLIGGAGDGAGKISIGEKLTSITIGGSFIGGSASGNASTFQSGAILSSGDMGAVKIGHDLIGGSATGTATAVESGIIQSGHRIASVTIGGSVVTGIDTSTGTVGFNAQSFDSLGFNAAIVANDDIGSLTVKGSLIGNTSPMGSTPVLIMARGQAMPTAVSDVAIGKINIHGHVELADILAGYGNDNVHLVLTPLDGNAQIGPVKVGGDWVASNLVAGVKNSGNQTSLATDFNHFGNGNDSTIAGGTGLAKIASIVIGGIVVGTEAAGDHFAFEAHTLGSFKATGFTAPFTTGNDVIPLSPLTADVTIREVP